MDVVVFARRFSNGHWETWEHKCDAQEIECVWDSARVKASDRSFFGLPNYADFLEGVRYIFNVARGGANNPRDGDLRVHGVSVDGIVIGIYEELRCYFTVAQEAA